MKEIHVLAPITVMVDGMVTEYRDEGTIILPATIRNMKTPILVTPVTKMI